MGNGHDTDAPNSVPWVLLHSRRFLSEGGWPCLKNNIKHSYIFGISHPNDYELTHNEIPLEGKRIAVYTCVTGGYDQLAEPHVQPKNVDFYALHDGCDREKNSAWIPVNLEDVKGFSELDRVRRARFIKTHPHLLFPDYDYSIWVDGNIELLGDPTQFLNCLGSTVPFASNWHPYRNCITTEATVCGLLGKEDSRLMKQQVSYYRRQGMPKRFGLIETNVIARAHNDEKVIRLMEAWWNEIATWSRRDQLSLPYVIWKQGYTMEDLGFICEDISKHPCVRVTPH